MEKIRREMGRKNVHKNPGGGEACKPGVYPVLPCRNRMPGTGPPENLPFSGGDMQGAEHRFRSRPRKTQVHRTAISGAVSKVPGASDHL